MRKPVERYRGWTIKTKLSFVNIRRGTQEFYECHATHPAYGETTPARVIQQEIAYEETIARIKRIEGESQLNIMVDTLEADVGIAPSGAFNGASSAPVLPVNVNTGCAAEADPFEAEFSRSFKHLNLTRRIESARANHRREPRLRPKGRVRISRVRFKVGTKVVSYLTDCGGTVS